MDQSTILIAALVVLVIAVVLLKALRGREKFPYQRREALLTPAERSFYRVLAPVASTEGLQVFAKVRLADIFEVQKGTEKRQRYQNRINQKHVDFLLCDGDRLAPVLAIELDDSSHQRADRQARDALVDNIYAAAGLPLLHVSTRRRYASSELAEQIRGKIAGAAVLAADDGNLLGSNTARSHKP